MKQITLNIPNNKFKTFLEFIKTLDYVKVEDIEENSIEELERSLKEVNLMRQGKQPKQSANDFLNEI